MAAEIGTPLTQCRKITMVSDGEGSVGASKVGGAGGSGDGGSAGAGGSVCVCVMCLCLSL